MNIGEELVASYLQHIRGCDFIQKNVRTVDAQGEIDVVGIDLDGKHIYLCEVAIHLSTGLQYVRDNAPDNVRRLTEKLAKDIEYAKNYFPQYHPHLMVWSPVVRDTKEGSKHNQMRDIADIGEAMRARGIAVEFVINEKFFECLQQMRTHAARTSAELKCPVLRLMQIEEQLKKHLAKADGKSRKDLPLRESCD